MAKYFQTTLGLFLIVASLLLNLKAWEIKKQNIQLIEEKLEAKDYYAILEIPKIDLKKELFPIDSKDNQVNKNLMILKESTFPNNASSQVIIAGHSGTASNAYFKDLYKLNIEDQINLYYDDYMYSYVIKKIEKQPKTGSLSLDISNQNMLILITCTKNNNHTQTIYYGWLNKGENL